MKEEITIQDKIFVFGLMVIILAAAFFGKIEEKTSQSITVAKAIEEVRDYTA